MYLLRAAVGAVGVVLLAASGPALSKSGPSFSCDAARLKAEIAVCESRRLSRLDARMAELYEVGLDSTDSYRGRRKVRKEQSKWLYQRNSCGSDKRCLRDIYEERVEELLRNHGSDDDYAVGNVGPSFDCASVRTATERQICDSERLSQLDRDVDKLYTSLISELRSRGNRRRLKDEQNDWLADRDNCRRNRKCIRRAYNDRISELNDPYYLKRIRTGSRRVGDRKRTDDIPNLKFQMTSAFNNANARTSNEGLRSLVFQDQVRWNEILYDCGSNRACQRRALTARIAELNDPSYLNRIHYGQKTTRSSKHDDVDSLKFKMTSVFNSVKARGANERIRSKVFDDQVQWNNRVLKACGSRRSCQRRVLKDRIEELSAHGYMRGLY